MDCVNTKNRVDLISDYKIGLVLKGHCLNIIEGKIY